MKTITIVLASMFLLALNQTSAQPYGLGHRFDLGLYNSSPLEDFKGMGFGDDIPSSYSLKLYTPYPGDQGIYGTCVGWSSAYCALTTMQAKQLGWTDRTKITALAFDPLFAYAQLKPAGDWNCQFGSFEYNAMTLFKTIGAKRYLLRPYNCGDPVDEKLAEQGRLHRIKSFKRLFSYPADYTIEEFFTTKIDKATPVKKAVGNGHAVVIGTWLPQSFFSTYQLWQPTPSERATARAVVKNNLVSYVVNDYDTLGGHAMCVVGYDDNHPLYGGVFEIQNSWGEGWGNGGYFYVKYEDFNWFCDGAYYFELFEDALPKTGCVTGDCDNGYGRYVFENGDIYEGEWVNGMYSGYGVYVWASGYAHGGLWKDNKRQGLATSTDGYRNAIAWEWDSDQPKDFFIMTTTEAGEGCISGDCSNGMGTRKYDNGSYTGQFRDGYRDGYGTYTFDETGNKFSGVWTMGQLNGVGKLIWPGGAYWIGEWQNTGRTGYGVEYFLDGHYPGYWLSGYVQDGWATAGSYPIKTLTVAPASGGTCTSGVCKNGYGTVSYANGDRYEGYFSNGLRSGGGTYYGSGWTYTGVWRDGIFDEMGKIAWDDGTYFVGEFRKGKADGYGVEVTSSGYTPGVWEFGVFKPGQTTLGFGQASKELQVFNSMADLDPADVDLLRSLAALKPRTR